MLLLCCCCCWRESEGLEELYGLECQMSGRGGGGKNADGVYIDADCRYMMEELSYLTYLYLAQH